MNCWGCDYAWGYQVISGKKVTLERDWNSQLFEEEGETYGYAIRQNDTIGILLTFRGKKASLTIDKNYVVGGTGYLQGEPTINGAKKTMRFLAPNVHDFT